MFTAPVFAQRLLRSRLLTSSGLYFVGQAFQKAASFLLIPVWTYYLTPADYGIIGTLAAYGTLLHVILMMGIYDAAIRHLYEYKDDPATQKSYVFTNFLFLAGFSGLFLAALWLLGGRWWATISSGTIPFHPFVILMLLTVWTGLISRMLLSLYQAQHRATAYVAIEGITFLLSVIIGLILVVGYNKGAYGQILGGFVAQAAITVVTTGLLIREWFTPKLASRHVRNALVFGFPLVPHLLSAWALTFVDRIMLERYVPLADVGFYNLGYNLGMGMLVLITSINQAYQPYYYGLMSAEAQPENKIVRIVSAYVAVVGLVALSGSLFAGEIIQLLTPQKYHHSAIFVPPIVVSYFLVGLYYFVGSPFFYFKKTNLLPLITGIAAILNILLNLVFIPKYGAIAAAWTTLIAYGAMLTIYYVLAQRISRVNYPVASYAIFVGVLLAVILLVKPSPGISALIILVKLGGCAIFALLAYIFLVRDQVSEMFHPGAKT